MKKKLSSILIVLGCLLLIVPFAVEIYSRQSQKRLLENWEQSKIDTPRDARSKKPAPPKPDKSLPRGIFGLLEIPKINVKTVVVEGTDPFDLAQGPGHLKSSAGRSASGNIVIAGHRTMYGAPFKLLNELRLGDEIRLEGTDRLLYKVSDIKKVDPADLSVTKEFGDSRITLSTCDPIFSARWRLVVIGTLDDRKRVY